MTVEQAKRFEIYLKKHPGISAMYEFKEKLVSCLLAKTQTKKQCKSLGHKTQQATAIYARLNLDPV
jgi:hypothetical protein